MRPPREGLPPFASMNGAPADRITDEIVGVGIGSRVNTEEAKAALGWVLGLDPRDGATVAAAWASFCVLGTVEADRRFCRRTATGAGKTFSWAGTAATNDAFRSEWDQVDADALSLKKARDAQIMQSLTADQMVAINRIVDERFKQAGIV